MTRVFGKTLVLAVLMQVLQSVPASASCGDWLDHATSPGYSQAFRQAGELPSCPCTGPHCKPAPEQPVPVVPLRVFPSDKLTACDDSSHLDWSHDASLALAVTARVRGAAGFASRIERPPRS